LVTPNLDYAWADELGKTSRDAVCGLNETLLQHLTEVTDENHDKSQPRWSVSCPIFEPGTSRIYTASYGYTKFVSYHSDTM
jgi:hypothetical protein